MQPNRKPDPWPNLPPLTPAARTWLQRVSQAALAQRFIDPSKGQKT